MLDRRQFGLIALVGVDWVRAQGADLLAEHMRTGRCAVLMRHALTDPGVGDPPGFKLGQCATQRNLSEAGRAQARAAGEWFRARKLQPAAVRCSAWCRCIDTAMLVFGRQEPWPALNSSFGRGDDAARVRPQLLERLAAIGPGRFEVWVTHQVNISAFTGEPTAMGEGLLVDTAGKMLGRSNFA
ncbi:MAG TPA: histidine phosphatase family protein [Variovorax sp.]|nr:histidine phosphatase family protein [Variovorax sp.]